MTAPVINARGLAMGDGDVTVVDDLSLRVTAWAIYALPGRHDAGETTASRMVRLNTSAFPQVGE